MIKGETLLQVFSRSKRPSLIGLNKHLWPNGPKPKEMIEINGETSTGKSYLILDLIKTAILPVRYENVHVNGLSCDVVVINTGSYFGIHQLVTMMTEYLKQFFEENQEQRDNEGGVISLIIEQSLKRLILFNIYDSDKLITTFYLLKRLILQNANIGLLIIDSITAFYRQDRYFDGFLKMETYLEKLINSLYKSIRFYNMTVIFTKPNYFCKKAFCKNFKIFSRTMSNYWNFNSEITLSYKTDCNDSSVKYFCFVTSSDCNFVKQFKINSQGIKFI